MAQAANINEILLQVKQLNKDAQLSLLERLTLLIRKDEKTTKLSATSGVGKEIWSGVDIDKYIETEREW